MTTRKDRRVVFVHIPRTGGSNLLVSATPALNARVESVRIVDLFGESLLRFGTALRTEETLAQMRSEVWGECLVHHHSSFGLWQSLGPEFTYFTVVRDPIERAVSHYFHSFRLYYEVTEDGATYHLKPGVNGELMRTAHGDNALATLTQLAGRCDLLSPEAVVRFTRMHRGMARNYLTDFMYRYFELSTENDPTLPLAATLNLRVVEMLAEKMQEHFDAIFFQLDDAFEFLERSFNVTISTRDACPNRAKRSELEGLFELREALRPFYQYDYYLISLLRSARAKAPRGWRAARPMPAR